MLTPGVDRWGQTPLHFGTSLPSGIQRDDLNPVIPRTLRRTSAKLTANKSSQKRNKPWRAEPRSKHGFSFRGGCV
jgi:hypothetical protein